MPRGPRLAFPNAFYHVFNRGINKRPIFYTADDYHFFLKKVIDLKNKYDHSMYAMTLMPNHFHISIHTRKIPISKIMSSLSTSYSMYLNRTYDQVGPVFQNRYKSILIENDEYFLELSRYIYLNAVRAGLVKDPLDYPYSTFKEAIGVEPLSYLDGDIVRLIGDHHRSQKRFKQFVYDGIGKDFSDIEGLFTIEEAVLGKARFSTRAKKRYLQNLQKRAKKKL